MRLAWSKGRMRSLFEVFFFLLHIQTHLIAGIKICCFYAISVHDARARQLDINLTL